MSKTFKRPESVLVVIYNNSGQFLLMNRLDDEHFWQSVTGSLDWGEDKKSCAYREVAEETGIDLKALHCQLIDHQVTNQYRIFPRSRHKYSPEHTHNQEYVFSVAVPEGVDIQLTEHFAYVWLDKAQAIAKASSDTNRDAIESINLQ